MTPEEKLEKRRERQREYYQINAEKRRQYQREYQQTKRKLDAEKIREEKRAYYHANIEKERERRRQVQRKARANNPELKERERAYKRENKALCTEQKRIYRARHPDQYKEQNRRRQERRTQTLADSYVAKLIGVPVEKAPDELIHLKRQQILIRRSVKLLETTIKEKRDER